MSLLILKEKNFERYYSFSNAQELELLASYIVRERHAEEFYEGVTDRLLHLALIGDNKAALRFLRERQEFEYEAFEIVEPGTIDSLKGEAL